MCLPTTGTQLQKEIPEAGRRYSGDRVDGDRRPVAVVAHSRWRHCIKRDLDVARAHRAAHVHARRELVDVCDPGLVAVACRAPLSVRWIIERTERRAVDPNVG